MSFQPTRRFLQACVGSLLLGMAAGLWLLPPPSRAQGEVLFFASSGQRLSNAEGFLGYWRASNGALTLGAPITAAMVEGDLTVQYFERGRLERHPAFGGAILRGRLGVEYSQLLWRSFAPPQPADQPGLRHFSETGYSLGEPFLNFWQANGGVEVFGFPIGDPAWEYIGAELLQVQYFERARLDHRPLAADPAQAVQIGALGRDIALLRGLPTGPSDPTGALAVDNAGLALPAPAPPPAPTAAPVQATAAPVQAAAAPVQAQAQAAPKPAAKPAQPVAKPARIGGKRIVVDLSDQWLYAYTGDDLVFDAPVSTGRDGFNTPVGSFAIYAKTRSQTMRGCAGGECWSVPDVPHAMYIVGGVALHGTYWHNQFGSGVRRSHGCINLPLRSAAWLYDWAPTGTPVSVRW